MQNLEFVQSPKSAGDLNEHAPYFGFWEHAALPLKLLDFLVEISIVGVLHNDATVAGSEYYRQLVASSTKASL